MYALCVSGAVNTEGFMWKFFMRYIYIFIHSFIHTFTVQSVSVLKFLDLVINSDFLDASNSFWLWTHPALCKAQYPLLKSATRIPFLTLGGENILLCSGIRPLLATEKSIDSSLAHLVFTFVTDKGRR